MRDAGRRRRRTTDLEASGHLRSLEATPRFRFRDAGDSLFGFPPVSTMQDLLRDPRVRRLLVANTLGSIGSGITIFAVPWLLVHEPEGNAAYRWITVATTLVLFGVTPYYGAWVDRHSRKTALLVSEAWGFLATGAMALLGFALGGFAVWQLMAVYFAGMLYYTLHYPAKFALIQQMFDRSQYQALSGLLEIQSQTAMMIAGGLGGLLVAHVPLWAILLFDAATYAASFALQATLPYTATHLANASAPGSTSAAAGSRTAAGGATTASSTVAGAGAVAPAPTTPTNVWSSVAEGWRWLVARPLLGLFFTCTLIPFVVVMAGNYLLPIYVAQTLRAGPGWFAAGEIAFACGAIAAGFMLPRLIGRHSAADTLPGTMLVFLAGLLLVIVAPFPPAFLAAGLLLGFGNAGCRVARSALLMHLVPNAMMGRVGGFYQVLDRVLRTLLVMAMVVIDTHGPTAGYLILSAVAVLAFAGALRSRAAVRAAMTANSPGPAPTSA